MPTVVLWVIATPLLIFWLNIREVKLLEKIESPDLEEETFKLVVDHKNSYGLIIAGF